MQRYIIIMPDVYAQPPPASVGHVSPDEGIALFDPASQYLPYKGSPLLSSKSNLSTSTNA
jgi:hypothetical protein